MITIVVFGMVMRALLTMNDDDNEISGSKENASQNSECVLTKD